MSETFQEIVDEICKQDGRYHPDAYFFLLEALDSTVKNIRRNEPEHGQHVSGRELLDGIKRIVIDEFGPLSHTVLNEWGIQTTQDFGEIVFHLVRVGRLGKTEQDSIEDFKQVYEFDEAFRLPFEPKQVDESNATKKSTSPRRRGKRI